MTCQNNNRVTIAEANNQKIKYHFMMCFSLNDNFLGVLSIIVIFQKLNKTYTTCSLWLVEKNVELNKQYVWEVHEILSACFWHFLINTEFMEPILAEKTSFVYDSFWTLYIPISIKKTLCTVGHYHILFVLFGNLQTHEILLQACRWYVPMSSFYSVAK